MLPGLAYLYVGRKRQVFSVGILSKAEVRNIARGYNTTADGKPFGDKTIEVVWQKGILEPGLTTFRKDACGASMQRDKYGKQEQWGWEIDHIKPAAKGGTDDLSNLQPLLWENNRHKGDNYPNWSCKVTT